MDSTNLPDQKIWSNELQRFFRTPDGARFMLSYFGKPLTSYTPEEWAKLQKQWEEQSQTDLPKYLRSKE